MIAPGVAGVCTTVTAKVEAADVPQELVAVTVIFPFSPVTPAVTVIEVVRLLLLNFLQQFPMHVMGVPILDSRTMMII